MELQHDRTIQSRDDRSSIRITNMMKDKYRQMPEITSEEMIQGYIPSPRIHLTDTFLTIPSRRPRFDHSTQLILRPDYSDLCLMNYHTDSAWIRYNEQRIEQLQQRINLMLQIDENEEAQLLLPTSSPIQPTVATVTQRIDDALMISPRYPHQLIHRGKKKHFLFKVKTTFSSVLLLLFSITLSISISIASISTEFSSFINSKCHTFDNTCIEICSNINTISSITDTFSTITNINSTTYCLHITSK